jgi:hypothetical protein
MFQNISLGSTKLKCQVKIKDAISLYVDPLYGKLLDMICDKQIL